MHRLTALMMEAARTSETSVNFYHTYTAQDPRRQPSSVDIQNGNLELMEVMMEETSNAC
jgi:hypothetical protein